jgi:hypothetical protein
MLPMEKSVTFTGASANEIIPSIDRSFVYKAKEGGHVRIMIISKKGSCIDDVIVSVLTWNAVDGGSSPDRVKPKTIILECVASPLSTQHTEKDWLAQNQDNVSAILWREQVNFQWDDDEVHFVQDQHAELDFYSASSQSADRHVVPLGHIILILSQPVFLLMLCA